MLRITPITAPAAPSAPSAPFAIYRLEGKLVEPWVRELGDLVERELAARANLRLDLAAVSFVDAAGIRLLGELLGKGVEIAPRSGYVAALLAREVRQ